MTRTTWSASAALIDRGEDAERHAEQRCRSAMPSVASSSVAGKTRAMSSSDRLGGQHRACRNRRAATLPQIDRRTARQSGWSSPSSTRAPCHRRAAGARSPTTASTGSIGMTRPITKVTSEQAEEGDRDGQRAKPRDAARSDASAGASRAAPARLPPAAPIERSRPWSTSPERVVVEGRADDEALDVLRVAPRPRSAGT